MTLSILGGGNDSLLSIGPICGLGSGLGAHANDGRSRACGKVYIRRLAMSLRNRQIGIGADHDLAALAIGGLVPDKPFLSAPGTTSKNKPFPLARV